MSRSVGRVGVVCWVLGAGGCGWLGLGTPAVDPVGGAPWVDAADLAFSGPYQLLIDLGQAPQRMHQAVHLLHSADLHRWSAPRKVAWGWSAIDALPVADGVVLVGSTIPAPDRGLHAPFGAIFALSSPDLERWGSHRWPIENAENPMIVDADLLRGPDGRVGAVYYSAPQPADPGMLPEHYPGPHAIKVAWWEGGRPADGGRFVEQAAPVVADEGMVDPSLCHHETGWHLFTSGARGVTHYSGPSLEEGLQRDRYFRWGQGSVPSCLVVGEELVVVAQRSGGRGAPQVRRFTEAGGWTAPVELFPAGADPFEGGCASPGLWRRAGSWVLACAVHTAPEGRPRGGGPGVRMGPGRG